MKTRGNAFAGSASGTLLALLVMFCWGSLYPSVKLGYRLFHIDTANIASIILFAGMRFCVCGAALTAGVSVRDRGLVLPGHAAIGPIVRIALVSYVLHYICTYIGVSLIPSAKVAILKQVAPLCLVSFAFLFRKEDAFSLRKLASGLLGFAGIVAVNLQGVGFSLQMGDLLILLASFFSAWGMVMSKRAYDASDPIYITAWAQLIGGVFLLALGLLLGGKIGAIHGASLAIFAYICIASCAGYVLWNLLLKYQSLSRLNTIKFAEPLLSALCAAVLLGEDVLRPGYWVAFGLVILGIFVGGGRRLRRAG